MIAARQASRFVHPLLHHGPIACRGDDEGVQVDLESIGDGVIVHARREPAGADQFLTIQAVAVRHRAELIGSAPGMTPASAANIEAQLTRARIDAAL